MKVTTISFGFLILIIINLLSFTLGISISSYKVEEENKNNLNSVRRKLLNFRKLMIQLCLKSFLNHLMK